MSNKFGHRIYNVFSRHLPTPASQEEAQKVAEEQWHDRAFSHLKGSDTVPTDAPSDAPPEIDPGLLYVHEGCV